jgi:hypothetical protein
MNVDTRGQNAALRAREAVARIDLPDPAALVIRRRRRRHARATFVGVIAVLIGAIGTAAVVRGTATSSRAPRVQVQPTTPPDPKATVEFRAVEYTEIGPFQMLASAAACKTGLPALPGAAIFFDRDHRYCYGLGPALLTGDGLESVSVFYDSASSQWTVDLRWRSDSFVNAVARPLVDKEMTIVVNGVVQTIAVVNPGISGRDVPITGNFTKEEAVNLVASITGVAPSAVPVAGR